MTTSWAKWWTAGMQVTIRVLGFALVASWLVTPASAQVQDGKRWRQLYETTGHSWNAIAEVCATDGVTPCWGSLGGVDLAGWTWATREQVVEFMGSYEPAILGAEPPQVSGDAFFFSGLNFTGAVMRWTDYVGGYNFYSEWTDGWTATQDDGLSANGRVSWGWWPPGGAFGVYGGADPNEARRDRGIWLWQPAGASWQQ